MKTCLPVLALAALAVFLWVFVRAWHQAVTIDEAITFTGFVLPAEPYYLEAHANNHILNSILMRAATRTFGVSHLTVRAGALLGASVYLAAATFLCASIAEDLVFGLIVFAVLTCNPFVLDFLVAARGYGLALGFLAAALAILARPARGLPACALVSLALALSFSSNFSFALVDLAVVLFAWFSMRRRANPAKAALALTIPGLLLASILTGRAVTHWSRQDMNYGAASLHETLVSVQDASFYEISPHLPRWLSRKANRYRRGVLPILSLALLAQVFFVIRRRAPIPALTAIPVSATALALAGHWMLFRVWSIPLPKDRTAIYLPVLFAISLGGLAAIPTSASRYLKAALAIVAVYFLLCARLSYFKEWKWDSDLDQVYAVLARLNHACGLRDVPVNWRFDASLNFYRETSGRETLLEFPSGLGVYPPGKPAYVLYLPDDRAWFASMHLREFYRGESGALVALDLATRCPAP